MAISKYKLRQHKIRVIALIMCVWYLFGGVGITAFCNFLHEHPKQFFVCECDVKTPHHFHQTALNFNFYDKCPICHSDNFPAVINCCLDNKTLFVAKQAQTQIVVSPKQQTECSAISPRAPPHC